MQLNIFVPKANYTFSAEVESLPTESLEYVIKYGATQAVVDTTAGIKRSDFTTDEEFHEAALVKAQKRWDQITSGNVPGSRVADPQAAERREFMKLMRETGASADDLKAALQLVREQKQAEAA